MSYHICIQTISLHIRKLLKILGINKNSQFFLVRFYELAAFHDNGIAGIDFELTNKIINRFSQHGSVFITSKKTLPSEFKVYWINIYPEQMYSVIYFASLYIGDSKIMTAEAEV